MGCTGGRSRESEVWRDLDALQQDVHSGHGFSAVHLAIKPGSETSLVAALESDLRLLLDALSELRFYAQQSPADQLRGFGLVPAGILGVGAMFGGKNTMYSAVARRTREVGVLRALGFRGVSILAAVLFESVMLALLGGLLPAWRAAQIPIVDSLRAL
jgi:ABC-type antimicrobial peptide transport system permease subunit